MDRGIRDQTNLLWTCKQKISKAKKETQKKGCILNVASLFKKICKIKPGITLR